MGPVLKNAGTNQVKMNVKVEVQPLINSAEFLGGASCLGQWPSVRGLRLVSQIPEFEIVFSCRTWHLTSSVTSLYVTRSSGQVLVPLFLIPLLLKKQRFGRASCPRTEFMLSVIS